MVVSILSQKNDFFSDLEKRTAQTDKVVELLGPITKNFFLEYGGLHLKDSGATLMLANICVSKYVPGALCVGYKNAFEIVQWVGNDSVCVVEEPESGQVGKKDKRCFPSIYHFLLNELVFCKRAEN